MKLLLLTSLILLIPLQQMQTVDREESDLTVVKFTWSKYRPNNDLISSVTDPGPPLNEPVSLKQPERTNESREARSRRDIQDRRAALVNAGCAEYGITMLPRRPGAPSFARFQSRHALTIAMMLSEPPVVR